MKTKALTFLLIAGIAIAGCSTNTKEQAATDSVTEHSDTSAATGETVDTGMGTGTGTSTHPGGDTTTTTVPRP